MENRLQIIFNFLQVNRIFNKELQERYYHSIIIPYDKVEDKIVSILYDIANTQSQPRIDYLAKFYKKVYKNINKINTFESFLEVIAPKNEKKFRNLFIGMKSQQGWGDKTSALFVKTIFHLHNGEYSKELKIWNDVPPKIEHNDEFYLPVDRVIISIFDQLDNKKKWDFKNINNQLKNYYNGNDIEIWDDLWFWGFITQNGTGENREFAWNENKYWTLKESDKDFQATAEIKSKAEEFLHLLNVGTAKMKRTTIAKTKINN